MGYTRVFTVSILFGVRTMSTVTEDELLKLSTGEYKFVRDGEIEQPAFDLYSILLTLMLLLNRGGSDAKSERT